MHKKRQHMGSVASRGEGNSLIRFAFRDYSKLFYKRMKIEQTIYLTIDNRHIIIKKQQIKEVKFSLVTRELIADSTEAMATAHPFDGLVLNCDKNVPGLQMAATRLNIPSIFIISL